MDKRNFIIAILGIVITALIYIGIVRERKIATQDNLIVASTDTLHKYKTTIGNQGAYISTLVGDKNSLINILNIKDRQDSSNIILIDSLKKVKNLQSATVVKTESNSNYSHKIDTVYKSLDFKDSISTKYYDASIRVKEGQSNWNVKTRDEIILTSKLKDNKGLFTGSTLTTYANSLNKDENVTGITSVSTVVNKGGIIIRPAIGAGLNSDLSGKNIRLGFNAGVVVTFK